MILLWCSKLCWSLFSPGAVFTHAPGTAARWARTAQPQPAVVPGGSACQPGAAPPTPTSCGGAGQGVRVLQCRATITRVVLFLTSLCVIWYALPKLSTVSLGGHFIYRQSCNSQFPLRSNTSYPLHKQKKTETFGFPLIFFVCFWINWGEIAFSLKTLKPITCNIN